jgi:hypothetical protein
VRRSEAFLTDSPGVDGGAFDIDYGTDDNVVEENYAHDTQGYCVAVFAAGWVTTNSVVRKNVCAANGLSPRLARRQGAVFLSTWNGGKIHGLQISDNQIFWNPPLATAALVNVADFEGTGTFERNTIQSESPVTIRSNSSLRLEKNSISYCGRAGESACAAKQNQPSATDTGQPGKWRLTSVVSASAEGHDSRGEVAMLESVHAQFPDLQVQIIVDSHSLQNPDDRKNLRYDWNAGDIPVSFEDAKGSLPVMTLVDPSGKNVWRHEGFTPPGEFGVVLRSHLTPEYAEMSSDR